MRETGLLLLLRQCRRKLQSHSKGSGKDRDFHGGWPSLTSSLVQQLVFFIVSRPAIINKAYRVALRRTAKAPTRNRTRNPP